MSVGAEPPANLPGHLHGGGGERRISLLAIAGLLASLACIPPMGFIGAALGGFGLWRITRARGGLGGRTPALAAIILGLVSSLLWTALAIGTASALSRLEVYTPALTAARDRDLPALERSLTAPAFARIDGPRLEAFAAAVEADRGRFERLPRGLAESFSAYTAIDRGIPAFEAAAAHFPRERLGIIAAKFSGGWAAVVVVSSPNDRMASGAQRLDDLGVARGDGSIVWLTGGAAGGPLP